MPLDAVCLRAVVQELNGQLAGGRIDKIYQPDREELVLSFRTQRGGQRLLLSASGSTPRMNLTEAHYENPAQPPMFCMLMRKYLSGGKLVAITQPTLERVAQLEFDTNDEMGVPCKRYLICELMGKYSNIILKGEDGRVIDAIRRIDGDISGKRQVLPGLFYRDPPPQEGKIDPLETSGVGLVAAAKEANSEKGLDKWLLSVFYGFSPLLCREIAYRATGETGKPVSTLTAEELTALGRVFDDLMAYIKAGRFHPCLLTRKETNAGFDFSCLPITQYEGLMMVSTPADFSKLLEGFYEKKSQTERMTRKGQELIRTVTNARDRVVRKLAAQRQDLEKTKDRETYKRQGELITANFYQLEKGMTKALVVDYYDEACPTVELSLDIRLTPQQNAQRMFKLYNKAKTAERVLTEQIGQGEQELDYLESVLQEIGEAETEQDLLQIREELVSTGVLSSKQMRGKKGQKRGKAASSAPFAYRTSDGFAVYAGRNNLQNDLLTHKTAFKSDIWFHTQKIHGSHVILVCDGREPTTLAMTEAAEIAAYHSKAAASSLVPVDYTPVRQVKKPAGAKPGFVIYHVYQTAYVTPDEEKIKRLRVR